jgi:hypothetical protein
MQNVKNGQTHGKMSAEHYYEIEEWLSTGIIIFLLWGASIAANAILRE